MRNPRTRRFSRTLASAERNPPNDGKGAHFSQLGSRRPFRGKGTGGSGKPPNSAHGAASSAGAPDPRKKGNPLPASHDARKRWRKPMQRIGILAAVLTAIGFGYLVTRPTGRPTPARGPRTEQGPVRGERTPVDTSPTERRPSDIRPGETVEEYHARIAAERAAEEQRRRPAQPIKPSAEAMRFYPEAKSREFIDKTIELLQQAGQPISKINWERKIWTEQSGQTWGEVVADNRVMEVTTQIEGKPYRMFVLVRKLPGVRELVYEVTGPLSGS